MAGLNETFDAKWNYCTTVDLVTGVEYNVTGLDRKYCLICGIPFCYQNYDCMEPVIKGGFNSLPYRLNGKQLIKDIKYLINRILVLKFHTKDTVFYYSA